MELDADYLDRNRETKRARWRFNLAALAVFASIVMLGDLVVEAKPLDRPLQAQCIQAEGKAEAAPVFNSSGQALCSRPQ
ncbi:hypothetical protein [Nitratireductor sp. XY-223]|uniref:hypothetical protein n=1 Tax=Nitratireductor sp. XY-223 TaxID=2561926 RepID=UPI0010AB0AA7|nr:hypothetical protein [Nitratireductor sp. XY-223]